ncbi:MAG: hypothetical protein HY290_20930 [Planctomycetia bacterium]|nr:hypothetical protein [Planctomycetia bacterium]
MLLAPWQNGSPIADDAVFAITENISHSGVAVILTQPFRFPHLCLGISTPNDSEASLCFFLGDCKHQAPLGGGFWSLGIELTDCASESCPQKLISLKRLAEGLHPGAVEAVCV